MKKIKICLLILILITIILIPIVSKCATIDPNTYKPNALKETDVNKASPAIAKITGNIRITGTVVSIGALMIIGIRYIVSSADEKAEYKERLFPYVLGAILLFAASSLVDIIYGLVH